MVFNDSCKLVGNASGALGVATISTVIKLKDSTNVIPSLYAVEPEPLEFYRYILSITVSYNGFAPWI